MLKKVMLLAAMVAMVLAAAVPALAQSAEVGQVGNGNVACVQTAVQQEYGKTQVATSEYGDATNINVQNIAQQCNVTVAQVDTVITEISGSASATASATASASAPAEAEYQAPAAAEYQYSSASAAELPSTGGSSLIALGAGVLLVAGGLLARRIVR